MKKFLKQLKKEGLTSPEKTAMKTELNLFMKANPPASSAGEITERVDFFALFKPRHRLAFAGSIIVVSLAVVSGAAYAAEESLPGDILYPIKINVNEKIRTVITLRPESRVAWEVRKTERRLEEIEKITVRGNLNQKEEEKLEVNLRAQTNLTRESIRSLKKPENDKKIERLNADLEKSLKKSRRIIEEIEKKALKTEMEGRVRVNADIDATANVGMEEERPEERPRPERTMIRLLEEEEKLTGEIKITDKEELRIKMEENEPRPTETATTTEKIRDLGPKSRSFEIPAGVRIEM